MSDRVVRLQMITKARCRREELAAGAAGAAREEREERAGEDVVVAAVPEKLSRVTSGLVVVQCK